MVTALKPWLKSLWDRLGSANLAIRLYGQNLALSSLIERLF